MGIQKFSLRSMSVRPGRTILTVLSIVIGTAAVVAVMITTATTRSAYKQMIGFVTGRAALEVATEGDATFSQDLLEPVSKVPGVKSAVPVLQRTSIIYANEKRIQVNLIGVDLERDRAVREYELTQGEPLSEGMHVVVDEMFGKRLGIEVGTEAKLRMKSFLPDPVQVVGFLKPTGGNALRNAGVVLIPLATMQTGFGSKKQLSTIQIVMEPNVEAARVKRAVAEILPNGVHVREPVSDSQQMMELLAGNEKVSQLAAVFTLVLSMFIILNTFLMNISERRRQLAILRAIGATRGQVMRGILMESLFLGCVGTVVGIASGVGIAAILNEVLAKVMEISVPSMQLSPFPFILATVVGLTISIAGALWPAYRAGKVSPLEGMDRVSRVDLGKRPVMLMSMGLVLVVISAAVILAPFVTGISDEVKFEFSLFGIPVLFELDFAILAGAGLMIGIVMCYPLVLEPTAKFLTLVLRPLIGVEVQLAARQILRHMTRSALTTGVVFAAASTGLSIAYTIVDNVNDVHDWRKNAIVGDFFVRAMLPDLSTGDSADLPPELGVDIGNIEHVTAIEIISFVRGRSGENRFTVIGRDFPAGKKLPFDLVEGNLQAMRQQLAAGEIVVGSVLAQRMKLKTGDTLDVETSDGLKGMRICGVTNDYLLGGISVYISHAIGAKLLGMEGADLYILNAEPEQFAQVQKQLDVLAEKYEVLLHTNADVTQQINDKISGIDGFLWGLLGLEFVVAAFGVVNTLTMNVLEQTREIGMLRIVAMTKLQVRRTVMTQALIIGIAGLVPGVVLGMVFAVVMNLSTLETTGHTIAFGFHPWLICATFFGALIIVAIAAWIPAQRAAKIDVVTALHYE